MTNKELQNYIISLVTSRQAKEALMREDYYYGYHYGYGAPELSGSTWGINVGQARNFNNQKIFTRQGQYLFTVSSKRPRSLVSCDIVKMIVDITTDMVVGESDEELFFSYEQSSNELNNEENLVSFFYEHDNDKIVAELCKNIELHGLGVLRLRSVNEDEYDSFSFGERFDTVDINSYFPFYGVDGSLERVIIAFWQKTTEDQEKTKNILQKIDPTTYLYYEIWTKDSILVGKDDVIVQEAPNVHGIIPFVEGWLYKTKNSLFSPITPAILDAQDEINKTLTDQSVVETLAGFPMFSPKEKMTDHDYKQVSTSWSVSPASLLSIPVDTVAQTGIQETSILRLRDLVKMTLWSAKIPIDAIMGANHNESGRSRRVSLTPLIAKAKARRRIIAEMYRKAAAISNYVLFGEKRTAGTFSIKFPPMLDNDVKEVLEVALLKEQLGFSKESIFEEMGENYYEEQEKKRREEENKYFVHYDKNTENDSSAETKKTA